MARITHRNAPYFSFYNKVGKTYTRSIKTGMWGIASACEHNGKGGSDMADTSKTLSWTDLTDEEKEDMKRQYIAVRAAEDEITEEEAEKRYNTSDDVMKCHTYIRESDKLWINI